MPAHRMLSLGLVVGLGVGVGSGCSDDEPPEEVVEAPAQESAVEEVSIDGNAFQPADITIAVGGEVNWRNEDSATHTVRADDGTAFDSDELAEGDTFSHQFDVRGEFAYTCEIHPFMHATITVE